MAAYSRFALTISCITLLFGCGNKDSYELATLCSHPVNQTGEKNCCAVGRSYPYRPDTFEPFSFSCEESASACASGIGGNLNDSRFPFVPNATYRKVAEFNSGCAVVEWQKNNFMPALRALSAAISIKKIPASSEVDCRKVCDYDFGSGTGGGDPGSCPAFELKADIVGSLFSFYSTVDPTSYSSDVTRVPIQTIATQFNVSDDEVQNCARSEVLVHKSGLVQNIGQACESSIGFDHQGNDIVSKLMIGNILSGSVIETDQKIRWMEYDSPEHAFTLEHSEENYNKLFGGYVKRSGMLYHAAIAEIVTENDEKICVQARPPLNVSKDDGYITKEADAEVIEKSARAIIHALGSLSSQPNSSLYPGFQDAVSELGGNQKNSLIQEIKASNPQVEVGADYVNSLAAWMDSVLCHAMITSKDGFSLDYIRAFDAQYVAGQVPERRNNAKTRLLRCAFSDAFVSENFKEGLRRAMQ